MPKSFGNVFRCVLCKTLQDFSGNLNASKQFWKSAGVCLLSRTHVPSTSKNFLWKSINLKKNLIFILKVGKKFILTTVKSSFYQQSFCGTQLWTFVNWNLICYAMTFSITIHFMKHLRSICINLYGFLTILIKLIIKKLLIRLLIIIVALHPYRLELEDYWILKRQ